MLLSFLWAAKEHCTFITMAGSFAKANLQECFQYRPVGEKKERAEKIHLEVDLQLSAVMYYAKNSRIDFHNQVCAKKHFCYCSISLCLSSSFVPIL